jgi:hypothetical protein
MIMNPYTAIRDREAELGHHLFFHKGKFCCTPYGEKKPIGIGSTVEAAFWDMVKQVEVI